MTSTRTRLTATARLRPVGPAITAANDAYIASLNLPPLTTAQADRIRNITIVAHDRITAGAHEHAAAA